MKKRLLIAAGVIGGLVVALQLVPYGRDHSNPRVVAEPPWDPATRALADRACFDCHSNQTRWPWYAHVAPVSWMVERNVKRGRNELNFSEWGRPSEIEEAAEKIRSGEMPPRGYALLHPEARLAPAEASALASAMDVLAGRAGAGEPRDGGDDGERDDD